MTTYARTILLYLALPFLSIGCAGARTESRPASGPRLTRADMKYQAVYVEPFVVAPAGVKEKEPARHVATAQSTCLDVLNRSGLFESVTLGTPEAQKAGLLVRAELSALRIVGGGTRFWLGAMAGKSDMRFHVTLRDAHSGALVAISEVAEDTNPWGGAWTFGATDRSLPEEVGTRLATFVLFGARK
ncbi:MAG TPA: DUF4410 domain-containing protein [Anaeromyxobacter sp.]|nr:DUF4410 domain-containing protein [Anaeromyxobacter sp.]